MTSSSTSRALIVSVSVSVAVATLFVPRSRPADAHAAALSSFDARAAGRDLLHFQFHLNATSVRDLVGGVESAAAVLAYVDAHFTVANAGVACARAVPQRFAMEAATDVVAVDVDYRCNADLSTVRLESTLFHDEATPHQVIGTVRGGGKVDRYFFTRGERVAELTMAPVPAAQPFRMATPPPGAFAAEAQRATAPVVPPSRPLAAQLVEAPARPIGSGFRVFYWQGIRHIFGGIDHLLFILSLVLAVDSWRRLTIVITAFTIAHSITLVLGTLGLVVVSPRLIEPLIALSIVFVALENVLRRAPRARFGVTFAFGLIHGFGFSSVLRGLGLSPAELVLPLFGFNLGVETGQLLVVAPVVPLLLWAQTHPRAYHRGRIGLSLAVAAVAAVWFVQRLAAH